MRDIQTWILSEAFAIDIDGTLTENGGGMVHLNALEFEMPLKISAVKLFLLQAGRQLRRIYYLSSVERQIWQLGKMVVQ